MIGPLVSFFQSDIKITVNIRHVFLVFIWFHNQYYQISSNGYKHASEWVHTVILQNSQSPCHLAFCVKPPPVWFQKGTIHILRQHIFGPFLTHPLTMSAYIQCWTSANTMRTDLLNWCHLVSISKNVVFYAFLVVRIY